MRHGLRITLIAAACAILALTAAATEKILIEKADDLPRYSYTIDMTAVELLRDEAAVKALAGELRADLESDLETYEIPDKTTLKGYFSNLRLIAFLDGRYDDALALLEKQRALEDKEATRLMTGTFTEAQIATARSGDEDFASAFERELAAIVNRLPHDVVQEEIKQNKAGMEIMSENLIVGQTESTIQPMLDGSGGEMGKEIAMSLIARYYTIHHVLPVKRQAAAVYAAYLAAHEVEKPNIWTDREIAVPAGATGRPVVAVWDSGVDTAVFAPLEVLWSNAGEIPDNGVDDDGNGYVDDVHGIAYTLDGDPIPDLLLPMDETTLDRATLQRYVKGLLDMQANIDSEEASEFKGAIGSLAPEEVRPFIEEVTAYNHYSHGTHVAGITAEGNPNIRLVAVRMTFDHRMVPEAPTVAMAYRWAAQVTEVVEYLKANQVRVVNMSWGGNLSGEERALELNNVGDSPEERKALARKIFTIGRDAFEDAIASAPEILFVTAAGNADSDVEFEEFIPSSFDLPNILTVGAVDQAGEETGFTSFGKVDVYANGFEVESYVPGGDRLPFSGTSMSSPNVANLAAKLLAVDPTLTPSELRELIIAGTDERAAGDRTVRLINPARTLELLQQR